ncbi:MAG: hypothetical protein NUV65_05940 [Candidatus Roizmanbacteria bacterium]|nr:hypothetical protein [Candidatus Roizmanbacteria bacterium]
MEEVKMPEYKIGNSVYRLREYGKLKVKDAEIVDNALGMGDQSKDQTGTKIIISATEIFPLMLDAVEQSYGAVDYTELTSEQIVEIISDYIAEKDRFFSVLGESLRISVSQKIGQKKNM